jgi:hypothetical protein
MELMINDSSPNMIITAANDEEHIRQGGVCWKYVPNMSYVYVLGYNLDLWLICVRFELWNLDLIYKDT